jgi:hypothetical protein
MTKYRGYDEEVTEQMLSDTWEHQQTLASAYIREHAVACGGDWCAMLYSAVPAEDRVLLEWYVRNWFDLRGLDHDSGGVGTFAAMSEFIALRYGHAVDIKG